jgi:hypothetical protein
MTARPAFSSEEVAESGACVTTTRPNWAQTRAASVISPSPKRPSTATPRRTREKNGSPGADTIRLQPSASVHRSRSPSIPTMATPSIVEAKAGPVAAGSPTSAMVPGPRGTPISAARRSTSDGSASLGSPASPEVSGRRGGARRSPKPSTTGNESRQFGQPRVPSSTLRSAI